MRCVHFAAVAAVLLLPGCAPVERHPAAVLPAPEAYVRISGAESNVVRLEIAARRFVPARRPGPAIWLTAVSHIGETNYYSAMQALLNARTRVLFEGVADHAGNSGKPAGPEPAQEREIGKRSSLQSSMAASLGLVFQLEALDYDSERFVNSDLTVDELRRIMAEPRPGAEPGGAARGFEQLLQMMEGGTFLDALMRAGLRFVGSNPRLQGLAKLGLMDALGEIQGDPSRLHGLPTDMTQLLKVLIERRDERVVADLKSQMRRLGRGDSVAVLYGAGHMPDLEQRLRRDLDFRPAGQIWFTAMSVNLARTGITPPEREFIRNLIRREMAAGR